jgi:gliding motility-associated-like protein
LSPQKLLSVFFSLLVVVVGKYGLAQPTITSFNPAVGTVGTLVTITGTNLNSLTALTIGGKNAIVISNNGSTMLGFVMPGTISGPISITTPNGNVQSLLNFTIISTGAPSIQQGSKLSGNGFSGQSLQGVSVAISADGNTAVVGGNEDNSNIGAVWIYTRTGNTWTQQGQKLVGTGYINKPLQGTSVAISADGNTVISGGCQDNTGMGAAWIFTRNGTVWSQQGNKLLANDNVGVAGQGFAVALSADGNTAVVGGNNDNISTGAVWVYVRTAGNWVQQGSKLTGPGYVHSTGDGISVAISADGNTLIFGEQNDQPRGAAWIYVRNAGVWTIQGSKLVGPGTGQSAQGISVAISADGNTAVVGGPIEGNGVGAVWVYARVGTNWVPGSRLVGIGAIGAANEGTGVAISADGNTILIGGYFDNSSIGAVWAFKRTNNTWFQQGKFIGSGASGLATQGKSVAISADGSTAVWGGPSDNSRIGAAWIHVAISIDIVTVITNAACHQNTGSILITATNGVAPYSYSIDGQTFVTGNSFTGMPSGNYTVIVRDASGLSNSTSAVVGNTCPAISSSVVVDDSCARAQGKVILSAIKGTPPYKYSVDGVNFQPGNIFASLTAGNYRIILEDAQNARDTVNVIVKNNCLLATALSLDATCGVSNGVITATGSGGVQPYTYSLDGINFQNSNRFALLAPGTYTITVRDANTTTGIAFNTIQNVAGPSIVNASTTTALCNNTNGAILLTGNGGTAPFQYSIDNVQYQLSNQFINDTAGIYTVSIKDANGCMASNTATVNRYPTPMVDLGKDTTLCGGQTIVLQAGNSFTDYLWSNGIISSSQTVTASGKYYVTVTDGNNCKVADTINITVQDLPVFSLGNDTTLCEKQSLTLQINVAGNYIWNDATTQNKKTITTPGSYWAEATNLGCLFRDTISIKYVSLPVLQFPADTILCDKGTLLLDATQTGSVSGYSWQDGSTSATYQVKEPGLYFVKVVRNGCTNADTLNVFYQQAPMRIINNDTSKCANSSVVLDVSFPNANYMWKDLSTSPVYTVTNPGFYYCTVSNYCGTAIDTIHVSDIDCECVPLLPNIFSPNGDGINDEFRPDIGCIPASFQLKIFNRAGQVVFESNALNNYWKGTFQNQPVPIGTYYYILKVQGQSDPTAREKTGSITLIR